MSFDLLVNIVCVVVFTPLPFLIGTLAPYVDVRLALVSGRISDEHKAKSSCLADTSVRVLRLPSY